MYIRQHANGWELLDSSFKQFGFNSEISAVFIQRHQIFGFVPCVDSRFHSRIWFCIQ